MKVEQYVMAYRVEQDRLRALLPAGFSSLRPVLRINAELRDGRGYVEYNTAVKKDGFRGWLNVAHTADVTVTREKSTVLFRAPWLDIRFTPVGVQGGCPAEKDNDGCLFPDRAYALRPPESIGTPKEFCDCTFRFRFPDGAHGQSTGVTLPAAATKVRQIYPRQEFTLAHAALLTCEAVLGSYVVIFER